MDAAKTKANYQKDSLSKLSLKNSPSQPSSSPAPPLGESSGDAKALLEKERAAKGSSTTSLKTATNAPTSSSCPSASASAVGAPPSAGSPSDSERQKKFRWEERLGMPVQLSEEEKRSSRAQSTNIRS